MREFSEQELVRREKLQALIDKGINPFGERFDVNSTSKKIIDTYDSFSKEDLEEQKNEVIIAGRIMNKRRSGKAGFMDIQDRDGYIQIYISVNDVTEDEYELFKVADLGDIIGINGWVCKTNTNQITVHATKYTHLVKALRPLPEKYHGLSDVEERFRRRYVDLIMNEDAKKVALIRPIIIRSIQNYLDGLGYIEVETPILGTILGGANARPFITHHNTLDIDMYLRIATELNLKRLLVGGLDAVYEIGRIFRNEGMDKKHNPEFTTIEVYKAFSDLNGMMDITEGMISNAALNAIGTTEITWQGHEISLKPPYKRLTMVEAIKNVTGIDFSKEMTLDEAKKLAEENHIEVEEHFEIGHIINEFFDKFVEDTLIDPVFITNHPLEVSPLARKCKDDPRFTQRFELYICGCEYGNAFTELNDPDDQYERFENQMKEKDLGNEEATDMDLDYVEALEYGMPPAGGLGVGIDRLVMMLTGSETIREVILFPTMKNLK